MDNIQVASKLLKMAKDITSSAVSSTKKHLEALEKIKLGNSVYYDYFTKTLTIDGTSFAADEKRVRNGADVFTMLYGEEEGFNKLFQNKMKKAIEQIIEIQKL